MTKRQKVDESKEIKLAGVIIMFALLLYVSPTIWNRYDKLTILAADKSTSSEYELPKPKPEYTLRAYFSLLDDYSIDEALSLMEEETVKYTRSIWEEDFSNIYFIKLRNFEELSSKDNLKTYRIRADVRLKGDNLKTEWVNGENIRIVTMRAVDDGWRIKDIEKP